MTNTSTNKEERMLPINTSYINCRRNDEKCMDYKALALITYFSKMNDDMYYMYNPDFDKYIQDMEISEIVAAIKRINDFKLDVGSYLDIISVWFRDILLFKATKDINSLIFKEEIQYIRKVAGRCSYEGIEDIIEALDKAQNRLSANVNFDLTMELLFLTVKENS